mmetsp:Transcript_28491/g.60359  ORF Transcript_28491/g.60359 Transcript_28491/m.60359 type:complete len:238 (+) Transcript_28491:111-824(+)
MLIHVILSSVLLLSAHGTTTAFVSVPCSTIAQSFLGSKKSEADGDVHHQQAFAIGTFVEFTEKNRVHIGKIQSVEHKSSGGARYKVLDSEDKLFDIADKNVKYSMACPNSPGQANKLYEAFCQAQDVPVQSIQEKLDVTPELLEMAWEEAAEESDVEGSSHLITSASFIELVHAHTASAMEKYLAWKLLQSEMSHIFFKEIKENGRVVAFKAKTRKAVDNAKEMFCRNHEDSELCFV